MKTSSFLAVIIAVALSTGCSKDAAQTGKARQEAEAKARSEAVRKESETLPKTFSTPNYFEKNEPAKSPPPKTDASAKTKTP
jgi:hypothetical protein